MKKYFPDNNFIWKWKCLAYVERVLYNYVYESREPSFTCLHRSRRSITITLLFILIIIIFIICIFE